MRPYHILFIATPDLFRLVCLQYLKVTLESILAVIVLGLA